MIVYDYFDRDGKIIATFTDDHETERKHFESLHLSNECRVSKF